MPTRFAVARAVLANRELRRAALAFLLFSVAEWATWTAIIVYAYQRGGPGEAGIVAFALFAPSILVAPAASVLGDRFPRARALAASYAVQAVAFAGAAIALTTGPALLAYAIAAVAANALTLTRPAHTALLPEIVATPDELAAATVASGTMEGVGALAGPAIAGVIVAAAGPPLVFVGGAVAALAALGSVVGMARRARPVPAGAVAGSEGPLARVLTDLRVGIGTVAGAPKLIAVLAVFAATITLVGAMNVYYAMIALDLLHLDAGAVGYLGAAGGLGAVIGAAATAVLVGRERIAWSLLVAATGFGLAIASVSVLRSPALVAVALVLGGAGWAFAYVEARTLAQRLAGDDVMTRVFGLMEALMMGAQAIGAILVPVLVVAVGPANALIASGATVVVVTVLFTPTLLRSDRIAPERVRHLRALRAVPMFAPLAGPALERLAADAIPSSVPAGTPVVREGDVGDRFFVILSGTVTVTIAGREYRRQGAGDAFGEVALLRDVPRTATVTALEPVEVLAIERGPFIEALTGQPRSHALAHEVTERHLAAGSTKASA